jgi:hypothetical protein
MPTGAVLYLGHDSAITAWVWFDASGARRGELLPPVRADGRGVAAGGSSAASLTIRRARIASGGHELVGMDRPLSRSRVNRAWTRHEDGTWQQNGDVRQSLARTADGAVRVSGDSRGMFRQIARNLQETYRLPEARVLPFTDTLGDEDEEHGSEALTARGFLDSIEALTGTDLDFFAYCGHGAPDGLASAGVRVGSPRRVARFVSLLEARLRSDGVIVLYACETGQEGGFAQRLSTLLPNMTVWGHNSAGTGSRNPEKVRYRRGQGLSMESVLGRVKYERWAQRLTEDRDLYVRFPFLTFEQIIDELVTGTRHEPA